MQPWRTRFSRFYPHALSTGITQISSVAQEMKPKKRMAMKTLEEIGKIAAIERARLLKHGQVIAGEGPDGKRFRSSLVGNEGPSKKPAKDGSVHIEIFGDGARGSSDKQAAVDKINVNYILWGHSQKTQLAGVTFSDIWVLGARHSAQSA
jgi:hypothetical protein